MTKLAQTLITEAIAVVDRDMAAAIEEMALTRAAHAVATARFMGLVNELVELCEAQKTYNHRLQSE